MKKAKKILLALGTFASIGAPIAAVVSCNQGLGTIDGDFKFEHREYKLFDFNDFGDETMKDEPIYYRGIAFMAQMHGMSFMFNLAKQLGWSFATDKMPTPWVNTYDADFSKKGILEDKKIIDSIDELISFKNTLALIMSKNNITPSTIALNSIKNITYIANDNDEFDFKNLDKNTINEKIKLVDFASKTEEEKKIEILKAINNSQLFSEKKDVYFNKVGKILDQLAVELTKVDGTNDYEMQLWFYTPNFNSYETHKSTWENLNEYFSDPEKVSPGTKDAPNMLIGNTFIDPIGSEASGLLAYTGTGTKILKSFGLDYQNKTSPKGYLIYKPDGEHNHGGEYKLVKNNIETNFWMAGSNTIIDGEHPGKLLWKAFIEPTYEPTADVHTQFATSIIESSENQYQTFYKLNDPKKISEMKELVWSMIENTQASAKVISETVRDLLLKSLPPALTSIIDWIKYKHIDKQDVENAFDVLNNGSHYMLGVELFARGIKKLPTIFIPDGARSTNEVDLQGYSYFLGLANSVDLQSTVTQFTYGTSKYSNWEEKERLFKKFKIKDYFIDGKPVKPTIDNMPFDPSNPKNVTVFKKSDYTTDELKQLQGGKIKFGKEQPSH